MKAHRSTRLILIAALLVAESVVAASAARGSIAGKVFDKASNDLLGGVTVEARVVTSDEAFEALTDSQGVYFVGDAPTGVYAFTLTSAGVEYTVEERMDLRVRMPFLLESCFELDQDAGTAHVLMECESGFVEEARVATIGPHRFLRPSPQSQELPVEQVATDEIPDLPPSESTDTLEGGVPLLPSTIEHDELECLTRDRFPLVDAAIKPGEAVQTSRVYFRSDKYPDFYYVDMASENPTIDDFRAILPKPSEETERILYYVESIDSNFDSLQTPEYDPEVLEVDECDDEPGAYFLGDDPDIIIGATQLGAAAIPPGFQAAGITGFVSSLGVLTTVSGAAAAGGGVASTTGLVIVVAGGGAAAAGTAVVIAKPEEASPPNN